MSLGLVERAERAVELASAVESVHEHVPEVSFHGHAQGVRVASLMTKDLMGHDLQPADHEVVGRGYSTFDVTTPNGALLVCSIGGMFVRGQRDATELEAIWHLPGEPSQRIADILVVSKVADGDKEARTSLGGLLKVLDYLSDPSNATKTSGSPSYIKRPNRTYAVV